MVQYPNIFPVDISKGSVAIVSINQICMGDAYANRVGATVKNGNQDVNLSGTCVGKAILANGQTVPISSGVIDGNTMYVDLIPACYAVEGPIKISVIWQSGSNRATVLVAVGTVLRTESDVIIDPGIIIPSVADLIQEIDDAVSSIPPDYSELLASVAPTFSTSVNYAVGDYVWYSGTLYRFSAAHTAGSWTGSDAIEYTATQEYATIRSSLETKVPQAVFDFAVASIAPNFSSATAYTAGQWVWHSGKLYRFTADHAAGAWTGTDAVQAVLANDLGGEITDLKIAMEDNGLATPVSGTWVTGKRMGTPDVGGTFSDSPGSLSSWRYMKLACSPGDVFTINAVGSSAFRTWAFADSDLKCLSRNALVSGNSVSVNEVITAPDTAAWLYINQNADRGDCYSGAFIIDAVNAISQQKADLASPAFTGTPTAPTATAGDDSTKIATTQFVKNAVDTAQTALSTDIGKRIFAKAASQYVTNSQVTLSDVKEDGFYLFNSGVTATDGPQKDGSPVSYSLIGLIVENYSPTRWGTGAFIKQIVFEVSSGDRKEYSRTSKLNGTYYDWMEQSVNNQVVYDVTNNNTYPQYSNTFNITTSPSITTDTNNWLQPTGDQTDMTGAIMSMLNSTGYCRLAPGTFYVSGSIDMPDGSCIEGCGYNTVLRLKSDVTDGYVLKMKTHNTVKNLRLVGGTSSVTDNFTAAIGTRHAIQFVAKAFPTSAQDSTKTQHCMLDNVWINYFSGAGINCYNTSDATNRGLYAEQVYIGGCHTGININFHSEFHKFVNVCIRGCYYGVMNNGGNNVFTSCTFHATTAGFVIDNSQDDQPNNAHGLCAECTFCHIGNNAGKAIWIRGTDSGYIFSCCQVHYCSINIENSSGIVFQGFEFGRGINDSSDPKPGASITITGGALVMFNGCAFKGAPDISVTNNTAVKFVNCFDFATGNAITA